MRLWMQFTLLMLLPLAALILTLILVQHRRARHTRAVVPLAAGILLNGFWASGLAAQFAGEGLAPALALAWQRAAVYAFPLAAVAFLHATHAFMRHQQPTQRHWRGWVAGGLLATVLLDPQLMPYSLPEVHVAGRVIIHAGWWRAAWVILWGVPAAAALVTIWRNYPHKAGPFHRNRVRYWALAVAVNLAGDLLALVGQLPSLAQAGAAVKTLAAIMITLDVITFRLPDLRNVLRRAMGILTSGAITFAFLLIGMLGAQSILLWLEGPLTTYWLTAGLALALAALFVPVRFAVGKLVQGLVFKGAYDLDVVLRNYSERISQVLELDSLAETVVEAVDSALRIRHGALLMVHVNDEGVFTFAPVHLPSRSPLPALVCPVHSPLVRHLVDGADALAQYDVDVLPEFDRLSAGEREVLEQWDAELYVPIRCRGQSTGVLALGAKVSGDPYLDLDLALLRMLADQTAVALENARLFEDLRALNQRITEMNQEIGRSNLELVELDKLKSSFIGTITHELRSPLVPIDLSLQLIKKHGLENMLPEQREQVEKLGQSFGRLRRMVDDLISFASLVSKQKVLQVERLELEQVVQDAASTLEVMSKARRVKIHTVVMEGMPDVMGDRERLTDAIHHLVHNAIKFNRSGGAVNVRCGFKDSWAFVEVEDTGRGIPGDRVGELGAPFAQVADPLKRGVEGMGLGLALVKYVAQAHGGRLEVESKLGVGSKFCLQIPITGPAARPGQI